MPENEQNSYETRIRLLEYRQDIIETKLISIDNKLTDLVNQPAKDAKEYKMFIVRNVLAGLMMLMALGFFVYTNQKLNDLNHNQVVTEQQK